MTLIKYAADKEWTAYLAKKMSIVILWMETVEDPIVYTNTHS